jgi:class 3 adenylate cyclase
MSLPNFLSSLNKSNVGSLARHGFPNATLDALSRFIAQAAERELYLANPRYWADKLGLDERTMLTLIVAGHHTGLFELTWLTTCPVCRYYGHSTTTLGGVGGFHHCDQCNHDYEVHLDEEIVITVSVRDTLRRLSPARRDDLTFRTLVDGRYGLVPGLTLITIPMFRELVSDQLLPEGQSLGVKRLAVFFSDLCGSTALYHKLGDTEAYRLVCEHFKVVFAATEQHGGIAVKTIGDGVMGVFRDEQAALLSVVEALKGLAALNERVGLTGDDRLMLKVGLHSGPCVVVTLNGRFDFFGETVNIAARLGGLAEGNDVILTHAILDAPETCTLAETLGEVRPSWVSTIFQKILHFAWSW